MKSRRNQELKCDGMTLKQFGKLVRKLKPVTFTIRRGFAEIFLLKFQGNVIISENGLHN